MKRVNPKLFSMGLVALLLVSGGCAPSSVPVEQKSAGQDASAGLTIPADQVVILTPTASPAPQPTAETTNSPTAGPTDEPAAEPTGQQPDGKGIVNFTVVLHLEGWEDGENEQRFRRHAELLRAYADLFERYGAHMTLESKEIIDGCINWEDNVLLELKERGHAVGIHADAGGEKSATVKSIARALKEMKARLTSLGIETSFASGVASRADWVEACETARIDTVSCMVAYGLWSLDPALRPDGFEPYKNPADGHDPYPFELEQRVNPWLMKSGSNWIESDPAGSVLLIPTGLSLNGASEELRGESVHQSELTQEDIDAWREALPRVIAASDSGRVNTFYAVWSFGTPLDDSMLESWLQLIDEYVQAGSIRWSTIPEMARLYHAASEG
jgi:hypothetical protein